MDGDDGGSTGDVSSPATDGVPVANPEPEPPPGPTEHDAAVLRRFAQLLRPNRVVHPRLPAGGPDTGHSAIFVERTRDDDGDGEDEGGGDPRHGDADADADATDADDEDEDDASEWSDASGFSFGAVPASGVAIACLPETTVGDGDGEARGRGECAVCLEEYAAGDAVRTMPCAHGFHERCIFGWLRASRLCPLCRFALPPEGDTNDEEEVEVRRDGDDQARADEDDHDGSDGAWEQEQEIRNWFRIEDIDTVRSGFDDDGFFYL